MPVNEGKKIPENLSFGNAPFQSSVRSAGRGVQVEGSTLYGAPGINPGTAINHSLNRSYFSCRIRSLVSETTDMPRLACRLPPPACVDLRETREGREGAKEEGGGGSAGVYTHRYGHGILTTVVHPGTTLKGKDDGGTDDSRLGEEEGVKSESTEQGRGRRERKSCHPLGLPFHWDCFIMTFFFK